MQLFLVTLFVFPFLTSLAASAIEWAKAEQQGAAYPSLRYTEIFPFENEGKTEKGEAKKTVSIKALEKIENQDKSGLFSQKEAPSSLMAASVRISVMEASKPELSGNWMQSSESFIKYVWGKGEELIKGIKGFVNDPFGMEGLMDEIDFTGVLPQTSSSSNHNKKV